MKSGQLVVLPASAGMILIQAVRGVQGIGAPRIRGDDPSSRLTVWNAVSCSPHPRG